MLELNLGSWSCAWSCSARQIDINAAQRDGWGFDDGAFDGRAGIDDKLRRADTAFEDAGGGDPGAAATDTHRFDDAIDQDVARCNDEVGDELGVFFDMDGLGGHD